jgi:hypothetical protein
VTDLEIAANDLDSLIDLLRHKHWWERQFLTDEEAIGSPVASGGANKGKAVEHRGGALSRFASESSLRHLQTAGWVESVLVRKLDEGFEPAQGRMRLWSLSDIMKADVAFSVAELADLPLLATVAILKALPGRKSNEDGERPDMVADLVDDWSTYVGATGAASTPGHELAQDGQILLAETRDRPEQAQGQSSDIRLVIVDRRWVLGWGFEHELVHAPAPWPLLEVKSFQNASPIAETIFDDADNGDEPGQRVSEAREAYDQALTRLEINLTEPLRRFLHRNMRA